MDEHPAAALHDARRERDGEGHVGVDGVADEDLARPDLEQVLGAGDHPRRAARDARSRRLAPKLTNPEVRTGLFGTGPRDAPFRAPCRVAKRPGRLLGGEIPALCAHPSGQAPLSLGDGGQQPPLDLPEMDVVVVPQAVACPPEVEHLRGPLPRIALEARKEGLPAPLDPARVEALPRRRGRRHAQ